MNRSAACWTGPRRLWQRPLTCESSCRRKQQRRRKCFAGSRRRPHPGGICFFQLTPCQLLRSTHVAGHSRLRSPQHRKEQRTRQQEANPAPASQARSAQQPSSKSYPLLPAFPTSQQQSIQHLSKCSACPLCLRPGHLRPCMRNRVGTAALQCRVLVRCARHRAYLSLQAHPHPGLAATAGAAEVWVRTILVWYVRSGLVLCNRCHSVSKGKWSHWRLGDESIIRDS